MIPDGMKERGLPLPVAVPGVHARGVYVIYDDGRPLVEAYDGPQIVGMDLHRRRSVLVRMTEDGRKLGTARIASSPARLSISAPSSSIFRCAREFGNRNAVLVFPLCYSDL
jgi:hypothetical protein